MNIQKTQFVDEGTREAIKAMVKAVLEYNREAGDGRRVLACGSREWGKPEVIVDFIKALPSDSVIIQGGARGADEQAGLAAFARGMRMLEVQADWARFGNVAGFKRNEAMLMMLRPGIDTVVAFWDGVSAGTKHTMREAERLGLTVVVIGEDGTIGEPPTMTPAERWTGERCPSCGHPHAGDIPKCGKCGYEYHPECFVPSVETGALDQDLVLDDDQKAKTEGLCRTCGADLEKQSSGHFCEVCGEIVIVRPTTGKRGHDDTFTRNCEECGSEIHGGRCECGLYHGDVVESERTEERPEFLGNKFYLQQHAQGCMCDACRIARFKHRVRSGQYAAEYAPVRLP